MGNAMRLSFVITVAAFSALATPAAPCTIDLSAATVQEFSSWTASPLSHFGYENAFGALLPSDEADLYPDDWVVATFCPFQPDRLVPEFHALLTAGGDVRRWADIANALYHVQIQRSAPTLWSESLNNIESFRAKVSAETAAPEDARTATAIKLLGNIVAKAESNSESLGEIVDVPYIPRIEDER